jgi:hypothetical protein
MNGVFTFIFPPSSVSMRLPFRKLLTIWRPFNLKQDFSDASKFDRLERIGYRMQRFRGISRESLLPFKPSNRSSGSKRLKRSEAIEQLERLEPSWRRKR